MVFKHTITLYEKYATHYGYEGWFVGKYEILIFFFILKLNTHGTIFQNQTKCMCVCVGYKVYKDCQRNNDVE